MRDKNQQNDIYLSSVKSYNKHSQKGNKLYMVHIVQNGSQFFSTTAKAALSSCPHPAERAAETGGSRTGTGGNKQ
ncbi:hypothetical protein [Allofournierella massiliensis]|uniref:hypothetical protein n=1 Tax=Allofournierella massiliensis TaxID=1650663 RepID=UPI0035635A34